MKELVEQLKAKRSEIYKAREAVFLRKDEYQATDEYQYYQQGKEYLAHLENEAKALDTEIRQCAIERYKANGNKNPVDGVSITVGKKLNYDDRTVLDWSIGNAIKMLKIDKRKFEKYAKAVADTMPLEFVTITDEPGVRIAKKLP